MNQGSESSAPLISVVIPVYNIQGYLDECLDSIAAQGFSDIEIIAIDDGSTDRSREILDTWARRDSRLIVVTEDRIGPGAARNIGMDRAQGKYVWFVDGDDTVATGCLDAIAQRIAHDLPDVLFTNHVLRYPDGHEAPGHDDRLIRQAPESCFSLAEQPWVIDLSLVCWNKIINCEFLRSTGLRFSKDWPHEEIPISCLLLPAADRLSVLDQICYHYSQRRPASLMLSGDAKRHFKIFNAFDEVLEQTARMVVNNDPRLSAEFYCAYFRRAIRHFTSIYDAGGDRPRDDPARYVPYPYRREYFRQMHREYKRFEPAGYRLGHSALDLKFSLIRAGAYRRYSALQPVNRLRINARRRLTTQSRRSRAR